MSKYDAVRVCDLLTRGALSSFFRGLTGAALAAGLLRQAGAAQEVKVPAGAMLTAAAAATLPDSPGFSSSNSSNSSDPDGSGARQDAHVDHAPAGSEAASHLDKVIEPGQKADRLTVPDKVLLGIRENATLSSVAGWVISAGYEQVFNNSPNYGQTGKGFAQRLGAAAARASSENIFSDSVIAPILHQDPRYYRMGSTHPFFSRLFYSGTRGLITRTDGGHRTINFANLGGDLGGSAMTQFYYPPINRGFTEVMRTWGGSIGGDALGYVVNEFFPNGFTTPHLHKNSD